MSRVEIVTACTAIALAFHPSSLVAASGNSGSPGDCEGLRSRLFACFERAKRVWYGDPQSYSETDTVSWTVERMPRLSAGLRFDPPVASFRGYEAEECSLTVWRQFYVDSDTIAFTMGRAPEVCSEAPRMIWSDAVHGRCRRIVSPLFNWNVEALWCTKHYLIFGLLAEPTLSAWLFIAPSKMRRDGIKKGLPRRPS